MSSREPSPKPDAPSDVAGIGQRPDNVPMSAAAQLVSRTKPDANVLAEYTAILEYRTQLISQRITLTTIYTGINTAVLGGIGYMVLIASPTIVFGLDTRTLAALAAMVPMLFVNYAWLATVITYASRLRSNFRALLEMEVKFAFEGHLMARESLTHGSPSVIEESLALLFLFIYPVAVVAIATANAVTILLGH